MPVDDFRRIARIYGRAADFQLSEEFTQALDLTPRCSLLDVGGGTGRVAATLNSRASRVVIADPSREMLHYATGKGLPGVCAPAEELPFLAESFDRIIMVDALHHVGSQAITASELWRVLKDQGRILILEPDIQRFAVKLVALGEKILLWRSHFLTHAEITALFGFPGAEVRATKVNHVVMVLIGKSRANVMSIK